MINSQIVCSAFPGTGKSHYCYYDADYIPAGFCCDSDSSKFDKSEFPQNYIEHINSNIGKYEYIFVSSHKEVRDSLLDNCIFFYLVFPSNKRKSEFIQRYRDRGNPESFIELIDTNWDNWINEMYWIEYGCEKITMVLDNLEDELNHLNRVVVMDDDLEDVF